ncbi:MAG: hypothetical protein QF441_00620 [Bacteriovoracaceae bacterium]|jgi:rubrerythrin|nr:hypothetical protein [Halobacteriovoraceae bacterium]MDP7319072.1 hypothetical protein [Bacteriovoracaceae bacterium]
MNLVKIAIMSLNEAKELKKDCSLQGVEIVLNHNEKTCNRGCSVTVEVHGKESDLGQIQEIFSKKYAKLLEGHDVNLDLLNEVFDPHAEKVTCPACGYSFSPQSSECPDCGLVLG